MNVIGDGCRAHYNYVVVKLVEYIHVHSDTIQISMYTFINVVSLCNQPAPSPLIMPLGLCEILNIDFEC
jgi:hypothetical protein